MVGIFNPTIFDPAIFDCGLLITEEHVLVGKTGGYFTVTFGGTRIDLYESVQYENTLDFNVDKATINFPNSLLPSSALPSPGQDVEIYRDAVPDWRGVVTDVSESYVAGSTMKQYSVACSSNKIYLDRETFQKNAAAVVTYGGGTWVANTTGQAPGFPFSSKVTDILADILACQSGTPTALTAGIMGSPIPHIVYLANAFSCLKVLSDIAQSTQWETRFNPDNTVDFGPQVGSNSSVTTFSEGLDIVASTSTTGIGSIVNDIIVLGAGNAISTKVAGSIVSRQIKASASDSASIASNGRWSKVVSFPNITDPNLLQLYANALLADLKQTVLTAGPITVVDLLQGVNFRIGDVITLNLPSNGIKSAQYRIAKISRQFDASGHEKCDVTLAQNFHSYNIAHFRLLQLEDVLKNYGTYSQQTTSVYTEFPNELTPQTS